MSREKQSWDTWENDKIHRERLAKKVQKVETLKALLQMWEEHPDQHEYILELRAKLRSATNQLQAMSL